MHHAHLVERAQPKVAVPQRLSHRGLIREQPLHQADDLYNLEC